MSSWVRATVEMPAGKLSLGDVIAGLGVVEAIEDNPLATVWITIYDPTTDTAKGQAFRLEDKLQVVVWQ